MYFVAINNGGARARVQVVYDGLLSPKKIAAAVQRSQGSGEGLSGAAINESHPREVREKKDISRRNECH